MPTRAIMLESLLIKLLNVRTLPGAKGHEVKVAEGLQKRLKSIVVGERKRRSFVHYSVGSV